MDIVTDGNGFPIGKAIGKAYNSEIKYFTHCFIRMSLKDKDKRNNPYVLSIICLGTQDILFFKENLNRPIFYFKYNRIKHLVIEERIKYNLLIHLDNVTQVLQDGKENKIPYIFLIIPERNYLIENLLYCYSVYHILVEGSMKNLLIKTSKQINFEDNGEKEKNNNLSLLKPFKKLFNTPPSGYIAVLNTNYA